MRNHCQWNLFADFQIQFSNANYIAIAKYLESPRRMRQLGQCPINERKKKKSKLFNFNLIYCTNRVHETQTKKKKLFFRIDLLLLLVRLKLWTYLHDILSNSARTCAVHDIPENVPLAPHKIRFHLNRVYIIFEENDFDLFFIFANMRFYIVFQSTQAKLDSGTDWSILLETFPISSFRRT